MAIDKKYKVIVSDRAKKQLGMHIRFMAEVNKEAATAKSKEIMASMRSLCRMPQRFPFFEESHITPNKYHKMFIEKWYLVLYQIQDDVVYVEYILDCRKDYEWFVR
ncbi:type II toxin-antitoxin system RelE/ParE family toxin [Ohessyouella blattaphilus]|uniref:Type II toxin-antitoxin system RelE/ParE family toxin n=1 Tax=Ohessyouella blattaphilus TaxID=2949333 RepID=A0ABT1EEV2_9FIRM|nr:type II toxin-antitoxin system RelE/ParE family toxin [Ohessyouella blattaphilus]MCP1109041.1 type II toxin-antitoxin system RelE/ParE family toxin [Ohessyouella blattaphilus]MCR8562435.1 type II toxin-antitoxin system RelE/ParE family toxin [Ohessyouella blattaphilus]